MKETEVIKLFSIIRIDHPYFEITDEKRILWSELMKELPFETALKNLHEHLRTNEFPPKAANIMRRDSNHTTHHEQLQHETQERLRLFEEWESRATDPPPQLLERWGSNE